MATSSAPISADGAGGGRFAASAGAGRPAGAGGSEATGGGDSGRGGASSAPPCEVDGEPGVCIEVAACTGDDQPTPGYCPGPADIQCCTKKKPAGNCDPAAMVVPDADLVEAPGSGGCPPGMLRVDTFCIDRYEAALVKIADGKAWSPYFNPGGEPVRAVSVAGVVPQAYIDGLQASAACQSAGKRLCGDDEWLRACRGPDDTVYPYGNMLELGVCNDHRAVHPAVELYGTTDSWIYSHLDNACLDQLPASLDKTGERAGCVTAEGAHDMMGNLHEWTAAVSGHFRGGYYVDTMENGPGCLYLTTAHNTSYWDYSTGFRCCADL